MAKASSHFGSTRARQYWRETFGLSAEAYERAGTTVFPHSRKLAGRNACWVFLREGGCLVSAPPQLVAAITREAEGIAPAAMLEDESIRRLLGDRVARTVGPSYQGYAERADFRPFSGSPVRRLSESDGPAVREFLAGCERGEVEDSGLNGHGEPLFGCIDGGGLVALAGVLPWSPQAANPGVIVHPRHRGKGCGKAVTSAAMECILSQGQAVFFQTLLGNRAAVGIATTLGCREYARMMYVALT
jgi:GNAT superfamily N-acetyltransferase